jgi:uncharacterized UBP type Zn finger protein
MDARSQITDLRRRFSFQGSFAHRHCAHLTAADAPSPVGATCPSCAEQGGHWVHLRMCLTCGSVGCCDTSSEKHARAHFEATGHPVMRSIEPGEEWGWCYPDRAYLGAGELRPA